MTKKYVTKEELMVQVKELKQTIASLQNIVLEGFSKLSNCNKGNKLTTEENQDDKKYATFSLYIDKKDYDILKQFDYDINDFYLIANFYLSNSELKMKSYDFYKSLN